MQDPIRQDELIFEAALEIQGLGEREAFLKQACASDPAMLRRLEGLLAGKSAAENFFAEGAAMVQQATVVGTGNTERVGELVGRYRLREKVGEGGCGDVYVADQPWLVSLFLSPDQVRLRGGSTRRV